MKKISLWMLSVGLLCGTACLGSCNRNAEADKADKTAVQDTIEVKKKVGFLAAVDNYLMDSIGSQYGPGSVCIPSVEVIGTNEENPDSVVVWGDFWVFNYNLVGDTLKTVSGGDHPGKMCVVKGKDGKFHVTTFEQVEDGHGNLESAKRIFGDLYEKFHAFNSNEEKREEARVRDLVYFLKVNKLPYKHYQDYGWPARELTVNSEQ